MDPIPTAIARHRALRRVAVLAALALATAASAATPAIKSSGVAYGSDCSQFGGSGYYVLAPDAQLPSKPVTDGDLTANGTLARKPDFLTAAPVVEKGFNWVGFAGYAQVKPPAAAAAKTLRLSGISSTMTETSELDGVATRRVKAVSFELAADAHFQLGVMVDGFNEKGAYAPDYVAVRDDSSDITCYNSVALTRDGRPDLVLFDITGKAGSRYSVILHRAVSAEGTPVVGLSALTFDPVKEKGAYKLLDSTSAAVGGFQRAGEYMKDYYVYKDGDTFHLFYNVGNAGPVQDWQPAGNEKAFGHATSKDLQTWQHHPRVLEAVPGTWEGQVVSAPSIVKHDGIYYMVYTGFDNRWLGRQTVGLATSTDLFKWTRCSANPVYTAPAAWARTNPHGWENCRDAHIIRYNDEFLMYTMVETKDGKGAIALASSKDAIHWEDHGPALVTFKEPESPRVFEHNGTYYMFASSGYGRVLYKTRNPKSNDWEAVPFNWPTPGLWSGWEVVEHDGRMVFSAFFWKLHGNFIRFWDVKWEGDVPTVIYNK